MHISPFKVACYLNFFNKPNLTPSFVIETAMAIDAYKNAYKMSPSNAVLAKELGRAYVKCHDYDKALKYYHDVTQNPDCSALKLDLAELFLKLKHFQNAISILEDAGGHNM